MRGARPSGWWAGELIAFARERLADFTVPLRLGPARPLSRNAGGKVLEAPLRTAADRLPVPRA